MRNCDSEPLHGYGGGGDGEWVGKCIGRRVGGWKGEGKEGGDGASSVHEYLCVTISNFVYLCVSCVAVAVAVAVALADGSCCAG